MPWEEVTILSQRKEFINLAIKEGANISNLCKGFDISRKTAYKWISRYYDEGERGLEDKSRRPINSPTKTNSEIEQKILKVRDKHPAWGGRKIKARLERLGMMNIPASSTISDILKRNNRIDKEESLKHKPWIRFEAEKPNDMWQMDFKGWFKIKHGECHPLTILDDHSRYSIGIEACLNERRDTVKERLISIFRKYGLPKVILTDNGSPFGAGSHSPYTRLGVWLLRLGIKVIHGKPYHPQTQGKDERFHRTLNTEVIRYKNWKDSDIISCQKAFNEWRNIYNYERPHESLDMQVPGDRYRVSNTDFKEVLPDLEYGPYDIVRRVKDGGKVAYKKNRYRVGKAFTGELVALRFTKLDGILDVFYCNHKIAEIDLNKISA